MCSSEGLFYWFGFLLFSNSSPGKAFLGSGLIHERGEGVGFFVFLLSSSRVVALVSNGIGEMWLISGGVEGPLSSRIYLWRVRWWGSLWG